MFDALILGLVEGFTEFIPVSSSGHLIIARDMLGINVQGGLAFDAILQLATILAVIVYFRTDILLLIQSFFKLLLRKQVEVKDKVLLYGIILGTIPAVILGLLLEKRLEDFFRNIYFVAYALILGSILMFIAEKMVSKPRVELTVKRGVWVGLFQPLALLSGFSRSGATISGGLIVGLSREEATRFSFLLSLPLIVGSGLKKLLEVSHTGFAGNGAELLFASVIAFVSGLCAIHFLITFLKTKKLYVFAYYRIVIAVVILFFL